MNIFENSQKNEHFKRSRDDQNEKGQKGSFCDQKMVKKKDKVLTYSEEYDHLGQNEEGENEKSENNFGENFIV